MTRLIFLVGSLRKESWNLQAALWTKQEAEKRKGVSVEIIQPDIPLFNEDLEQEHGEPDSVAVRSARAAVRKADAVIIFSPEYDALPTGVLINFLNWCSRNPDKPFIGKPVAIIGASPGKRGTRTSRPVLRSLLLKMNANLIEHEAFIPFVHNQICQGEPSQEAAQNIIGVLNSLLQELR